MIYEKKKDGVLAKRAIRQLKLKAQLQNSKIIIEGIRNSGEVAYLRTLPGFILIAVDTSQKVRFNASLNGGKPWDPKIGRRLKKWMEEIVVMGKIQMVSR